MKKDTARFTQDSSVMFLIPNPGMHPNERKSVIEGLVRTWPARFTDAIFGADC